MTMKNLIPLIALAAALSGPAALAADQAPGPNPDRQAQARERFQAMLDELDLSDDQKAQITPILQKEGDDLKALRDDTSLTRMQRMRRARDINQAASKEVRALLTPDQQKKYDEIRAEAREKAREKMKERREAGGGPPPAP
jgi:Spy/CpxP family protein refolding chaperone